MASSWKELAQKQILEEGIVLPGIHYDRLVAERVRVLELQPYKDAWWLWAEHGSMAEAERYINLAERNQATALAQKQSEVTPKEQGNG